MSTKRTANTGSKRPASPMEHEGDKTDLKKQKTPASPLPSPPKMSECIGAIAANLDMFSTRSLPDEQQDITHELETGSHTLVLEHNWANNAKCRAFKCLVQEQPREYDQNIRSPYRLNLQVIQPTDVHWSQLEKPNRRFFHVSCFEAIGVDVAKYVTLPPERVLLPTRSGVIGVSHENFHPAVVEWVKNKGKAFDADVYGDYENALATYYEELDRSLLVHSIACKEGKCACGVPLRPKSTDFISGEPLERSLTNVLLSVLGADHLMPLSQSNCIVLLEILGKVPASFSKAAIAIAKQKENEKQEEERAEEKAAESEDQGKD